MEHKNEKSLSGAKVCIFGAGHLGIDLVGGMVSTYLLFFYTDVFGIPAAAAGMILMLTKIWDAINDPMMGAIVDSTHTKWGKFRPYLFVSSVLMAIFYAAAFYVVPFESVTAKIVWAAITYTLASMAFTMFDVPIWGMVPSITKSPRDRDRLITALRTATSFAYLTVGTITLPLVYFLGGGTEVVNQRDGFFRLMVIMGIIVIVTGWLVPIVFKEKVEVETEKTKFSDRLKSLFINKPALLMLGTEFMAFMGIMLSQSASIYYVVHSLQKPELVSVYMFIIMGGELIGILGSGAFINKLGRKNATYASAIACIVTAALGYLFKGNIPVLFVTSFIFGLGTGLPEVTLGSMLTDTADYMDWKKSIRTDGIIFSMQSLIIKLTGAFASGIIGVALGYFGYDESAATQTASAIGCIDFVRFGFPILVYILVILLLKFYKLDDKTISQIQKELAERKSNLT